MKYLISTADADFKKAVETCQFPVANFDHRAHLRLAYVYLVENNSDNAVKLMRDSLLGLLKQAGIDPSEKYHHTLTKAWVLAVNHFMSKNDGYQSADDFINHNTEMLDSDIMMTHYSAELLFSPKARQAFVEPNIQPIPNHKTSIAK